MPQSINIFKSTIRGPLRVWVLLLTCCLGAMAACTDDHAGTDPDVPTACNDQFAEHSQRPNLRLTISLDTAIGHPHSSMQVIIRIYNADSCIYYLLFDHPQVAFYGPWATSAAVTDATTDTTLLELADASVLSSRAYLESELDSFRYRLLPHQSIVRKASLDKIAVFKNRHSPWQPGEYRLQLFYYGVASNVLPFSVVP